MAEIRHRVGISAPKERVYDALATVEGIAGWWSRDVDGDSEAGGTLRFYFGNPEPRAVLEVTGANAAEHVGWRCVEGPDDWVGTGISFDLKSVGEETVLLFSHTDWREPTEFMSHCSTKWGYFLLGLKASLEGGEAAPYPSDLKVSSWG